MGPSETKGASTALAWKTANINQRALWRQSARSSYKAYDHSRVMIENDIRMHKPDIANWKNMFVGVLKPRRR